MTHAHIDALTSGELRDEVAYTRAVLEVCREPRTRLALDRYLAALMAESHRRDFHTDNPT